MIIDCPECNKKFEIEENLIPINGRLLQCGSCDHKWFYQAKDQKKNITKEIELNIENVKDKKIEISDKKIDVEQNNRIANNNEIEINSKKHKQSINYLNILIVAIISIAAFILVIDTFKSKLILLFPNIDFFLNNLYETIKDLKLFAMDLLK